MICIYIFIFNLADKYGVSQVVLVVRIDLPMQEMQERRVCSLGWENPLEEEMATHSSILAWEIPWTEEPGRLQSIGLRRVRHDLVTKLPPQGHHSIFHDNVSLNPWKSKGCELIRALPVRTDQDTDRQVCSKDQSVKLNLPISAVCACMLSHTQEMSTRPTEAHSVDKLCLTVCDLMDSSQPGSSVHGIFQARILGWVAISYSRGSS